MSNDMWVKMAEFLGNLNGENVNRESYIRTPEYEEALTAWKETELEWEEFLKTLSAEQQNQAEKMKDCLEDFSSVEYVLYEEALTAWRTLRLFRREGHISRDMRTACRCCFIWDY